MEIEGDYLRDGYALVRDMVSRGVARALMAQLKADLPPAMAMGVGDAVAYRGVDHRHGRITPNPNAWSAHLFLHWVDPDGPFADQAFDGAGEPKPVNFTFSESKAIA